MKLSQLTAKPQLIEVTIDDEDTIKEFGEAITFHTWDRQPMDVFMKLANATGNDTIGIISIVTQSHPNRSSPLLTLPEVGLKARSISTTLWECRWPDLNGQLKVLAFCKVAKCVNLPALSDWFLSLLAPNCPLQRSLIGWLANPRQPRAGTSMSVNGTCADWSLNGFNPLRALCFELPLNHDIFAPGLGASQTQSVFAHYWPQTRWLPHAAIGVHAH